MSDQLGLRGDDGEEVKALALYLLHHTGGVARLVSAALDKLCLDSKVHHIKARPPGQDVWAVLTHNVEFNLALPKKVQEISSFGMQPNWSVQVVGWDLKMTQEALLKVVRSLDDDCEVQSALALDVAVDKKVTVLDLLSVLGVPYQLVGGAGRACQSGAREGWSLDGAISEK